MHESIIGRAAKKGIVEINCVQIRDYTDNKQNQVDDYPYGGGFGCVMMAQPLEACLRSVLPEGKDQRTRVIYMSPQGQTFNQAHARRLKESYDHLVLVCGHYEGVDERFIERCVDEELSIGDFVLTGGEIAAMAVADSVCRLVPGVLADEECYTGESHWDGLLEYPQYTRPEEWNGMRVPQVLLDGDHEKVAAWRRRQQFTRTMSKRPDMFEKYTPETKEDKKLMAEAIAASKRTQLTEPVLLRDATEDDLQDIVNIITYARKKLGERGVDQWQSPEYPTGDYYREDMSRGECFVLTHGDDVAAVFSLSFDHDPDQDTITDGKWSAAEPYCTLHRCAVAEKYRGTEMASIMMRYAEQKALELGMKAIRTDTHRNNKSMKRLLADCNYRYRGNITITFPAEHDKARQAFEKIIKEKRQ